MSPEHLQEILELCEASTADDRGFRELPGKTALTLYLACEGVGLTISEVDALAVRGHHVQARTRKGNLFVLALEDVFAANIEGRAEPKPGRRAGFASE